MAAWTDIEVLTWDRTFGYYYTKTVTVFVNDTQTENPGWRPPYQWDAEPPEPVPKLGA